MPFIGQQPITGAYHKLDSITTSATATYNLQLNGGAYSPTSANHLMVSLNGVMQAPQDSFTVSGSQIIFDSALTSSDNIDFIMALGDVLDIGVPSDGAVNTSQLANSAVTDAKILDANITTAKLADGNVTTAKLDANAVTEGKMDEDLVHTVKISEASLSSAVSSYDILLDESNYERYILYLRDLSTSNGAVIRLQKLISAGVTGDTCYGGGRWAGEGLESGGEYGGAAGFYFLGDTDRVSMDTGTYKGAWRFDIVTQSNNMMNLTAHGAHRQGAGYATNITSGCININTGANYGIRIDTDGTLNDMHYTLYGVKQI